MSQRTLRFVLLAASIVLGGCSAQSFFQGEPAPVLYVLRPQLEPLPEAPQAEWALTVAEPDAPLGLATVRIAIQRSPETLDYYANAAWQDRAPLLMQRALIEGFEKSGKIAAVARDGDSLRADYLLQTDLRRFEAVYDSPDGAPTVTVDLEARLLRVEDRRIVASTVVKKTAAASANSIPAAVAAFDQATAAAVEDLTAWTLAKGK